MSPSLCEIELKAAFSTDEDFNLSKLSQKVAALDGILACAIVTDEQVIETCSHEKFAIGEKLRPMAAHIRGLALLSEKQDASYFTIQQSSGALSFFFAEKNWLAIKHTAGAFKNGAREKIMIAARAIDTLEN